MKLISWNVNGLRACIKNGFEDAFRKLDADVVCLQETKAQQGQVILDFSNYREYWNSADKKGYAGTAIFTRVNPLAATYGIGVDAHDHEGRVITLEFRAFYLINVYVPNARRELVRLDYRMQWEEAFRAYAVQLAQRKPVVMCGDFNVAHTEADIKNAKSNVHNAGFTVEERGKMTALLQAGFTDFFRDRNPARRDAYTWWSYMPGVRERNVGWRIDYFLGSDCLRSLVRDTPIYADIYGSDHCPVGLEIDIT